MVEGYLRRVQLTGRSTLTVSLPKEWARKSGVVAGSLVRLVPRQGMGLLLIPEGRGAEEKREARLLIEEGDSPDAVVRELISLYLAGFDIIRVSFATPNSQLKVYLKDALRRRLMGMEILSETAAEMLTQCFAQHMELPLRGALRREGEIAGSMERDAVSALMMIDRELAKEVVQRDDEVDRLFHFITRQLNLAAERPGMLRELGLGSVMACLSYAAVAKAVERVGDHASSIAKVTIMLEGGVSEPITSEIERLNRVVKEVFGKSLRVLEERDKESANQVVEAVKEARRVYGEAAERVMEWRISSRNASLIKTALEDLLRIAEYSADIAEQAIFLALL